MVRAYESREEWPDRLRAVAYEVIEGLSRDPSRASFGVEVLAAGDAARARRDMTMRVIASLIDAGRQEMEDPEAVPHTTAEALAGSAYGQIYAQVVRGAVEELPALVPQLMSAAVMPYLGIEAAMAELSRESAAPGGYASRCGTRSPAANRRTRRLTMPRATRRSWRACRRGATACRASSSPITSASA